VRVALGSLNGGSERRAPEEGFSGAFAPFSACPDAWLYFASPRWPVVFQHHPTHLIISSPVIVEVRVDRSRASGWDPVGFPLPAGHVSRERSRQKSFSQTNARMGARDSPTFSIMRHELRSRSQRARTPVGLSNCPLGSPEGSTQLHRATQAASAASF